MAMTEAMDEYARAHRQNVVWFQYYVARQDLIRLACTNWLAREIPATFARGPSYAARLVLPLCEMEDSHVVVGIQAEFRRLASAS